MDIVVRGTDGRVWSGERIVAPRVFVPGTILLIELFEVSCITYVEFIGTDSNDRTCVLEVSLLFIAHKRR